MKYILFTNGDDLDIPIVFSEFQQHDEVKAKFPFLTPVGAGFVQILMKEDEEKGTKPFFWCWGKSVSLGLKAESDNSERVTRAMNFRA